MTIKELIAKLETYPPETRLIQAGYEGGYDNIDNVNLIPIKVQQCQSWYWGKYDKPKENEQPDEIACFLD